ncbi:MAG: hypothetical protein ABI675_00050 [Chitinophagaceae bacterium]
MDDKDHQSTTNKNSNDYEQMEAEILNLIEKYLNEKKKDKDYDEEIATVVYFLLGGRQFQDYLANYMYASVSVLSAFASNDITDSLKRMPWVVLNLPYHGIFKKTVITLPKPLLWR